MQDVQEWLEHRIGGWCYYDNDAGNGDLYGKLYNGIAVSDLRGLAPEGWHVPSDEEWEELEKNLGMSVEDSENRGLRGDIGEKLKEAGNEHWEDPDHYATNESGLTVLPGGYRNSFGIFCFLHELGSFWSSSVEEVLAIWGRRVSAKGAEVYLFFDNENCGFSVRCVKD